MAAGRSDAVRSAFGCGASSGNPGSAARAAAHRREARRHCQAANDQAAQPARGEGWVGAVGADAGPGWSEGGPEDGGQGVQVAH